MIPGNLLNFLNIIFVLINENENYSCDMLVILKRLKI